MQSIRKPGHVVGIGASAGGLEALERFFDNLPADTGMAFVVIQHLSPDFRSLMDELLARHTTLPIHLVEHGMAVEADTVYLIPPKKEMVISGGRLMLGDRDRQQELTLPIDLFFRSLAQDCGRNSVGIILSGGGSDGSRGVRDIHDAGGLVIVQDAGSAQFDGMPRATQDSGVAHWVLAPENMPGVLVSHASGRGLASTHENIGPDTSTGIRAVYRMLQDEFGIDFNDYKPSTVTRRIDRRLMLAHSRDIDEYLKRLSGERTELDQLYRDLLIGVTKFFRDKDAFALLENEVLPALLDQHASGDSPLRIWVAGCATGEEVYSLAIVLCELMAVVGERPVQIFATDVHRGSLEHAGRGIYEGEALANVSAERLARYFQRHGKAWQVIPELRQMVVFAAHDVIKDAPFTRVDLISCRNLLIYLQPFAQQKVLSLFHFALNRNGVLFLGPSESPGPLAQSFEHVDKHWRIYRKHSDVRVPVSAGMRQSSPNVPRTVVPLTIAAQPRQSIAQLLSTYDALLEEHMPPSLLVGDHGELIHAFGGASGFLKTRDGRQALDVLEMVDPELRMVLSGAMKRALNDEKPATFKGLKLSLNGKEREWSVSVRKVAQRHGPPSVLVSFAPAKRPGKKAVESEPEIDLRQISRDQLATLEVELTHTRENLQAAVEELEASNEELQASNEELQASNEELQSTNEELQSVNEELYTVNSEYQRKISELTELTNDMDNLLTGTEIGTIFLDSQLRIRKFTPQIAETFSLLSHDVGRPIETFAHRLDNPELVTELRQVLESGQPIEKELRDLQGHSYFLRILPYRVKGAADGVVLTVIDVSGLRAAEDALFHERYLLNSLLESVPDAIYFMDAAGKFIRVNEVMSERLGLADPRDAIGRLATELNSRDGGFLRAEEDEVVLKTGKAQHYRVEKRDLRDGGKEWNLVTRLPLHDQDGAVVGMTGIFRNITEQKRAEERIQEAVRLRDQFLAMLSHELRNPLGAIVAATSLLKDADSPPPEYSKLMGVLDRQSQQMAHLLDDLLETSRVTQSKIHLRKRVIDLNGILREAADGMRGLLESRGITFNCELGNETLFVNGDPARLQQIHVNLLSNALKYTPEGGVVTLRAMRQNGSAVVSVSDNGVGIAPDMLESVFDLFVQSSHSLHRAAGGLGVGLTLVRSLVAMHGGEVQARSEGEGKGSEFLVHLPITTELPAADRAPRRMMHRLPETVKVVVVEDNADSREILCDLLRKHGFECYPAASGTAGLKLIEEITPTAVLLDVGLPEMDGFEVARRVRSKPELDTVLLIALTGYGRQSDRLATHDAGFDEHLVKPVRAEQLVSILTAYQEDPEGEVDSARGAPRGLSKGDFITGHGGEVRPA